MAFTASDDASVATLAAHLLTMPSALAELSPQDAEFVIGYTLLRRFEAGTTVIAQAGKPGTITVATHMAGRGTDIHLSETVLAGGGLHVINTHLNASGRVDRQLSGRAARQGQPGSFEFILREGDHTLAVWARRAWVWRWAEALGQIGLGRTRITLDLQKGKPWPEDMTGSSHHMGTARMAAAPNASPSAAGATGAGSASCSAWRWASWVRWAWAWRSCCSSTGTLAASTSTRPTS